MMKKTIILSGALLLGLSVFTSNAQQLPNVGFDSWKGTCGKTTWTSTMKSDGGFTRPGDEPTGWCGSSVKPFNTSITESVTCTKKTETENGNTYVTVGNNSVLKNVIPGYMTVAQPWVFVGGTGWSNAATYASGGDGGSHSSVAFAYRPDALTLRYQKTGSEKSHIIAMLWDGTFKSYVPSSCDKNGNQTFGTELEDVDRVVIGRQDDDKVTQKGTLVASLDKEITAAATEWTTVVLPLEYKTTEVAPKKMNVVLAASDYWTRANLKGGTSLSVDDVDFVYYSTLTSLTVGGNAIALQDGVYTYNVAGRLPASADAIASTCKSQFATAKVTVDEANYQVKIVVTNQGGKDLDGLTEHTYVLQYKAQKSQNYDGILNVQMGGEDVIANADKSVTITYYNDGTCDFVLPNFSFAGMSLGDISVPGVKVTEDAAGTKTFTDGEVEAMKLADGEIVAHVVLNGGTITADGVINMPITVGWMIGYPEDKTETPINVLFSSDLQYSYVENGYYHVLKNKAILAQNEPTTFKAWKSGEGEITYTLSLAGVQTDDINFGDLTVTGVEGSISDKSAKFEGTDAAVTLPGDKTAKVEVICDTEAMDKLKVEFNTTVDNQTYNIWFTNYTTPTGVDGVVAAQTAVTAGEGVIRVNGFAGVVDVYTADGRKVASVTANGEAQVAVAAGIYVVRAGNKAAKVIVK